MIIAEAKEKCKVLVGRLRGLGSLPRDILIFGVLLLASLLSFGLGYLAGADAGKGRAEVEVRRAEIPPPSAAAESVTVSKSGTKYYFSWCSGVSRIAEANRVQFASAALAEAAGYTRAANCSPR